MEPKFIFGILNLKSGETILCNKDKSCNIHLKWHFEDDQQYNKEKINITIINGKKHIKEISCEMVNKIRKIMNNMMHDNNSEINHISKIPKKDETMETLIFKTKEIKMENGVYYFYIW